MKKRLVVLATALTVTVPAVILGTPALAGAFLVNHH